MFSCLQIDSMQRCKTQRFGNSIFVCVSVRMCTVCLLVCEKVLEKRWEQKMEKYRQWQESNLRGITPIDFQSVALTTRPQCLTSSRCISMMGLENMTLGLLDSRANKLSYTDSIYYVTSRTQIINLYSYISNITSSLKHSHTTRNTFSTSAK